MLTNVEQSIFTQCCILLKLDLGAQTNHGQVGALLIPQGVK